jgi:hypothetical protein
MTDNQKTLWTETQFSVFLVNKPNTLARVCQQLANDKINILAISMMDSTEHGVLRLIAENTEAARRSLALLDVPTAETTVLLANLPNRPGALADVVERLASAHIGVNYAYVTSGARNGRALGVFRVADIGKALNVLEERKPRRRVPLPARLDSHPRRK